jgi:hypothetical protein
VITLFLYPKEAAAGLLIPLPILLRPAAPYQDGTYHGDFDMGITYKLLP